MFWCRYFCESSAWNKSYEIHKEKLQSYAVETIQPNKGKHRSAQALLYCLILLKEHLEKLSKQY